MVGINQLSQMLNSNDGHAINSLQGVLQKTSKFNALLRLRISKIFPLRYQRLSWTKQPSWNSSNNIFKPIFSLEKKIDEKKIDGCLQGKMETQNCLNHSNQISKMAIHVATHIFQPIYSLEQKPDGRHHATWRLRISKIILFRNQR